MEAKPASLHIRHAQVDGLYGTPIYGCGFRAPLHCISHARGHPGPPLFSGVIIRQAIRSEPSVGRVEECHEKPWHEMVDTMRKEDYVISLLGWRPVGWRPSLLVKFSKASNWNAVIWRRL